jgi:hypothetical protein
VREIRQPLDPSTGDCVVAPVMNATRPLRSDCIVIPIADALSVPYHNARELL